MLVDGLIRCGMQLAVPKIVLEEVVNKYREKVEESLKPAKTAVRNLRKLGVDVALSGPSALEAADAYRVQLETQLAKLHVFYLDIPATPHSEVVAAELSRRKPFASSGAGYRDFLIWRSLRDHLRAPPDLFAALVTQNTSDFAQADSLHPDLVADLTAGGVISSRVQFFKALTDFNDKVVAPNLEKLDEFATMLKDGKVKGFDIRKWFSSEADAFACDSSLVSDRLGFDVSECHRVDNVEIYELAIHSVTQLLDGDIVVTAGAQIDVRIEVVVGVDALVESRDAREFVGSDMPDGTLHNVEKSKWFRLSFEVDLTLKEGSHELEHVDINSVSF